MITNKALAMRHAKQSGVDYDSARSEIDEVKTRKTREGPGPYYCEADKEYWADRKANFVLRKKLTLIKKPLYFNNVRDTLYPNVWQVDRRETTIDISDWEMSNIVVNMTGATLRRHEGTHAIDWCSTQGISSHLMADKHETVMTVECNSECMTMARTNIKNVAQIQKNGHKHSFKELPCNIHTAHIEAMAIDWSVYDTVRLGSSSAPRIYNAIRSQLKECKLLFVNYPSDSFIKQLQEDGFKHITNLKAQDYFAKD